MILGLLFSFHTLNSNKNTQSHCVVCVATQWMLVGLSTSISNIRLQKLLIFLGYD